MTEEEIRDEFILYLVNNKLTVPDNRFRNLRVSDSFLVNTYININAYVKDLQTRTNLTENQIINIIQGV